MGYFWFGEDTYKDWILQNALEAATYGASWYIVTHPKQTWQVARPVSGFGLRAGWGLAKYATRVSWAAGTAVLRQPIIRGVSAGHIAIGYLIGATVGTGIAYAGWGKEGASDAIDLYTGQVSFGEYMSTVGQALDKTWG